MLQDEHAYMNELKDNCFIQEGYFIKLVKHDHKDPLKSCQIAFQLEEEEASKKLQMMNLNVILSDRYEQGINITIKLIQEKYKRNKESTLNTKIR